MGWNIAGLIIGDVLGDREVAGILETEIQFLRAVTFEEATSNAREEHTIDILVGETGLLVIFGLEQVRDLSASLHRGILIQFVISDVSDTYFFEQYNAGRLVRKLIISEEIVVEEYGEGIISDQDDFTDKLWELMDEYVQSDFFDKLDSLLVKRYKIG